MRRNFSPLFGLLMAAIMLAAIPAAFAAAPSGLPFGDALSPTDTEPSPPHLDDSDNAPTPPTPQVVRPASEPAPPADLAPPPPPLGPRPVDDIPAPSSASDLIEPDHPKAPHEIKLRCVGSVDDLMAGSVECNWTARESLEVNQWQLWNVRVRPDHGERNLVAELRPDVTSFVDRAVEVPGHYLYTVLGLNAAGEIIARSAVAPVDVVAPPVDHGVLRLKCRPAANIEREFTVGCEWSASESETAVGYVMWRGVDGGDRVAIARSGLDVRTLFDTDVSMGHRYIYVIMAVDAAGEVVGRSRPEHVGFPGPGPRPEPRPVPVPLPGPEPRPVPVPLPGPVSHPAPEAGTPGHARVVLSG